MLGCAAKIVSRKPAKTIIHKGYDPGRTWRGYDIALIRVDKAIPLHSENSNLSGVSPVCIPFEPDDPGRKLLEGDRLVVTGWGRITNSFKINKENYAKFNAGARVLQLAEVPAVSRAKCQEIEAFESLDLDPKLLICAGGELGECDCKTCQCLNW